MQIRLPAELEGRIREFAEDQHLTRSEAIRRLLELGLKGSKLFLELYVSGVLRDDDLPPEEQERLLDTVLAAGEAREFEPLGLPFPRR